MPSLATILAAILEVLGRVQAIQSLVQAITGAADNTARENVPFTIETNVAIIDSNVRDPAHGLAAIIDAIQAVRLDTTSPHIATITDVLDTLSAMPPVTLPTIPPDGYGGATTSQVWGYLLDVPSMCSVD